MIKVAEVFGKEAEKACAKFGLAPSETDRVFALTGECEGVGLSRFEDGRIKIIDYRCDGGAAEKEFLLRSLMLDATRVKNCRVEIIPSGDYGVYGFVSENGVWSATSDKIVFPHECKGE